jgi:hypothetical protein
MKIQALNYLLLASIPANAQLTPIKPLKFKKELVEVPQRFKQAMNDSFWVNKPESYQEGIFYNEKYRTCQRIQIIH